MAIIKNGPNGTFSGKAGSVVGSSWRSVNYIKGLPKASKQPKSPKQLEQQAKFGAAVRFLQPITDVLNLGLGRQKNSKATGYNLGLKQVLDHAITGDFPDYEIDFSKVVISKGKLDIPVVMDVKAEPGKLVVSWLADANNVNSFADDRIFILAFDPGTNIFFYGPAEATRSLGEAPVNLPPVLAGSTLHVYVFAMDRLAKKASNSMYAGNVEFQ